MMTKLNPRLQRLRDAGYKLTNARVTVVHVLEHQQGHLTSAQVLDAVAAIDTNIGRASVFRTLDLLTQLAIIRPTFLESSVTPSYVLLPDGHHHHIVCTQCNRVVEFENCGLADLARTLEARYGMQINGHLLEFYARCLECAATKPVED
ncbi:MAG: transcriptional repressor [Armatimonadetes bacterium]|nr:transcriptional repressor [Anaerolineae bacterium]